MSTIQEGALLWTPSADFIARSRLTHYLDWLARDFVKSGWDVKRFLKQIVMSATYQQSSRVTADRLEADPENRLLSHGPRFRLDAEVIRDQALSVSGLLVDRIGGRSVKPYQPAGLWKPVGFGGSNTATFVQDKGDKLYRRSMYTFWKRTSPPPSSRAPWFACAGPRARGRAPCCSSSARHARGAETGPPLLPILQLRFHGVMKCREGQF